MNFERFWSAYPRKLAKGAAKKKFDALTKSYDDAELTSFTDELVNAIDAQKRNRKELESAGEFVPPWKHPTTWLNGECWNDELKSVSEIRDEKKERHVVYCECGKIATQQNNLCARCWTKKYEHLSPPLTSLEVLRNAYRNPNRKPNLPGETPLQYMRRCLKDKSGFWKTTPTSTGSSLKSGSASGM